MKRGKAAVLLMIYCTAVSTSYSYSVICKTFLFSQWRIRLCPIHLPHAGEINPQVPFYEYYDESKLIEDSGVCTVLIRC